jgi:endonuclease YncB( thermonuclease family)
MLRSLTTLLLAIGLVLTPSATVAEDVETSIDATLLQVVDPATLDLQILDVPERVRLIGVQTGAGEQASVAAACLAPDATARVSQLVDGQPLWLEADPMVGERDALGYRLGHLRLSGGESVAELLVREGLAHASSSQAHLYQDAFRDAQVAAQAEQLGVWAPDACAPLQPSPELAAFVMPMLDQTQRARIALDILSEQALVFRTNPAAAANQPAWEPVAISMLSEVRSAGQTLQATAPPEGMQVLGTQLTSLGVALVADADAYSAALQARDAARISAFDATWRRAVEAVLAAEKELVAVAQTHGLND